MGFGTEATKDKNPYEAIINIGQWGIGRAKKDFNRLFNKKNPPYLEKQFDRSDGFENPDYIREEIDRQVARLEEALAKGKQDDRFNRRGRIEFLRGKLAELEESGIVPEDDFMDLGPVGRGDQEPSPVFGPAAGAAIGSVNYRKEAGKWIKAAKERTGTKRKVKLPKTGRQKLFETAGKLLKKIPKGLLPDAELLGLGKIIGKAGARAFGPAAIAMIGVDIIQKISDVVRDRQFAEMERILGTGTAQIAKIAKIPNKKPAKLPGKPRKSTGGLDPPRPRPPTSSASPGRGKVPRQVGAPKAKLPTQIKVKLKKRPLPKNVPYATPTQVGMPTNQNVKRILEAAAIISKISKGVQLASSLGLTSSPPRSSPRITNSLLPRTQTRPFASYANPPAPTTTGTGSGCYTVCRKKNTGKKKRKKPRICVTPAAAAKAGLI